MNTKKFLQFTKEELEISRFSKSTIKNYMSHLERFLNYCSKNSRRIRKKDVKKFLLEELKDLSNGSIHIFLASIKFSFLAIHDFDPTENVKRPRLMKYLPVVLSQREIEKLIENVGSRRNLLIISLLYGCGLRVSEVTNLQIGDFHFPQKIGYVRNSKGNKDRIFNIPKKLSKELKKLVREQKEKKESYIFSSYCGGKMTTRNVQKMLKKISERSKITKKINPHTLRHSFATHLIDNGVDIIDIQALLGHDRVGTTMRYIQLSTKRLRKVKSPVDSLKISI